MGQTPNHPREHKCVRQQVLRALSRRPSPCSKDASKSFTGIPHVASLCFYSRHTCVSTTSAGLQPEVVFHKWR